MEVSCNNLQNIVATSSSFDLSKAFTIEEVISEIVLAGIGVVPVSFILDISLSTFCNSISDKVSNSCCRI